MYDTLHIVVPTPLGYPQECLKRLDGCAEHSHSDWGYSVSGHLANLRITSNERSTRIKGSLPKYFLGDNIQTLRRSDTEAAVGRIEDQLSLSLRKARVTRIDVGANVLLDHPVQLYYPYLGTSRYMQRLSQPESLYYQNSKRQLILYDKLKESKKKGAAIPSHYLNSNLLRIEMRLTRDVAKQMNRPRVLCRDLYDEHFYMEVCGRWKEEFNRVQKIDSPAERLSKTTSSRDLTMQLAAKGLEGYGWDQTFQLINEWQCMGLVTKKQAYDHRRAMRSLQSHDFDSHLNGLIHELVEKVDSLNSIYL